jgi:MFS family permease
MSEATLPQSSAGDAANSATKRAARYALYFFWIMFFANFVNYLQRFIFIGLSPYIQLDLKFNDFQYGVLITVFAFVYAVFALPLGFLADRIGRKFVVGVGMMIASVAQLLTGTLSSFAPLIGAKSLFGFGQSGFYPAGQPLIAAQYPATKSASVIARWTAGALIGLAVGTLLAGFFDEKTWRTALLITAIPGFLAATLVLFLREKRRRAGDSIEPTPEQVEVERQERTNSPSAWARFVSYLKIPTFRVLVAVQIFGFFALAGTIAYLPIYLNNAYGQKVNKFDSFGKAIPGTVDTYFGSAGLKSISLLAGVVILLGGIVGTLYGGRLAARLALRTPNARVVAGSLGFLFAAPFIVLTLGAPFVLPLLPFYADASLQTQLYIGVGTFLVFGLAAAILLNMYNGPLTAALLDVLPPSERGAGGGTQLFLAHMIGDVFAALEIGALSVFLTTQFGGEQIGLALLLTVAPASLIAGLIGIWGSRYYKRDVENQGTTAEEVNGIPIAA